MTDKLIVNGKFSELGCGKSFNFLTKNEWYRLITGPFFHLNVIHLLGNVFAVYFAGAIVENIIGSWMFLLIYMLGNLGTTLCFSAFTSFTYGTGASPGIYALIGCMVILHIQVNNMVNLTLDSWKVNYIFYYFILGNLIGLGGLISHVTGFAIGTVLSIILFIFIGVNLM